MLERLEAEIKSALLAGDKERARALSYIRSTLLTIQKDSGESLAEERIVELLRKEVKKRHEAAELFEKGGNQASADKERSEAALIETFLPSLMDAAETEALVKQVADQQSISLETKSIGQLIGAVRQTAGNRADGALIAKIVNKLIAEANKPS